MVLKSKEEIELMRRANLIVYEVLQILREMTRPGITTAQLNERAIELTKKNKARPAFLGYPGASSSAPPFPGVICVSKNEAIVHGIPNDEPLVEGDILSIDFGCEYEGFYGDSAITVPVGKISATAKKLLDVTERSLNDAIEQCVVGKRIGDIGHAVQSRVEANGFNVVRDFVGHGIGRVMHEEPAVPNFGKPATGRILKPGLVLAIEPMVTAGSYDSVILADGWTAVTKDGNLAAHFEHTVAVTENGPYVLSKP